jgi:hypothetical protein
MIYLTVRLFSTDFYCVDFPCFYELSDGVLEAYFSVPEDLKDLSIFVSVYPEHASGGYCDIITATKGESVNFLGHKIQLTDTGLLIDDKIIKAGDDIHTNKVRIKPINIWWIYHEIFMLKNHGQIYGLKKNSPSSSTIYLSNSITEFHKENETANSVQKLAYPSVLVMGYATTNVYLNFVIAFIYIGLFVYLIKLTVKMTRKKSTKKQ